MNRRSAVEETSVGKFPEPFRNLLNGAPHADEMAGFCSNLSQYRWSYICRKEMLIPLHGMAAPSVRWALHRVCIIEGRLCRGESNLLARRCAYLDERSGQILLGDGFDRHGTLVKYYVPAGHISAIRQGQWHSVR